MTPTADFTVRMTPAKRRADAVVLGHGLGRVLANDGPRRPFRRPRGPSVRPPARDAFLPP